MCVSDIHSFIMPSRFTCVVANSRIFTCFKDNISQIFKTYGLNLGEYIFRSGVVGSYGSFIFIFIFLWFKGLLSHTCKTYC